jgi:hypothetical protein
MFMSLWPFKKSPPPELPTQKQLNYAKKLGIKVTAGMSKWDVSEAIESAERRNPKLKRQREHIIEKKRIKDCGSELIAAEKQWQKFAETVEFMLAIYKRGKETIVDVLRVNDVFVDGHKKKVLKLCVESPRLVKDKDIGCYLDWDHSFELPIENLFYYEPLHADFPKEILDNGISVYTQIVKKGLRIAKRL